MSTVKYVDRKSIFHSLDPRTKIVLCTTIMVVSLIFNHPLFLAFTFVFVVTLSFIAKIHTEFLSRIRLLVAVVIFAFVLWTLAYRLSLFVPHKEVKILLKLGPIIIDELSFLYGISMPFRVLVLIGTPLLLFMTTAFTDMTLALVKLRLPYTGAFTISLSLRLVTSIFNEAHTIRDAQLSRGLELEKGSLLQRIRNYIPIISPLVSKVMKMEDQLSISMETKAFGAYPKRTYYKDLKMTGLDITLIFSSICLFLILLWLRLNNVGIIA